MEYTVPSLSIVFMATAAIIGLAIPIGLLLYFRRRHNADVSPFWFGCAVFIVFVLILENAAKLAVMQLNVWPAIQSNIWLFGIIAALFVVCLKKPDVSSHSKRCCVKNRVRISMR